MCECVYAYVRACVHACRRDTQYQSVFETPNFWTSLLKSFKILSAIFRPSIFWALLRSFHSSAGSSVATRRAFHPVVGRPLKPGKKLR